jgi:quinol monooxygenase YgiN
MKNLAAYSRWSELEVDSAHMDRFRELANDNVRETRRAELGVLAFHWAAMKNHPSRIRVLEIYTDESAYKAHLESAHYQRFRDSSRSLLKGHSLHEAIPVAVCAKTQLPPPTAVVRMAEIVIDHAKIDSYRTLLKEMTDTSFGIEPGVLAIYAVALKCQSNQLKFFEIYENENAYLHHCDTDHFQRYCAGTKDMITSLDIVEGSITDVTASNNSQ